MALCMSVPFPNLWTFEPCLSPGLRLNTCLSSIYKSVNHMSQSDCSNCHSCYPEVARTGNEAVMLNFDRNKNWCKNDKVLMLQKRTAISLNVHKFAIVQTISVFLVLKCLYSPADKETEIKYKSTWPTWLSSVQLFHSANQNHYSKMV